VLSNVLPNADDGATGRTLGGAEVRLDDAMCSAQALKLIVGHAVSVTFGGVLLRKSWQLVVAHRLAGRGEHVQALLGNAPLVQGSNSAVIR
jgi:hypothetical protein